MSDNDLETILSYLENEHPMGNECVGSLSPQGDLLGFAVAIFLASSMAMLLSGIVDKDHSSMEQNVTASDLRSVLDWTGFDLDDDGVLMAPSDNGTATYPDIGTRGDLVAVLSTSEWNQSFLFRDGRFIGSVPNVLPESPVRSVTVLILVDGSVRPGTVSAHRPEVSD